jgi:hypothetical protein
MDILFDLRFNGDAIDNRRDFFPDPIVHMRNSNEDSKTVINGDHRTGTIPGVLRKFHLQHKADLVGFAKTRHVVSSQLNKIRVLILLTTLC